MFSGAKCFLRTQRYRGRFFSLSEIKIDHTSKAVYERDEQTAAGSLNAVFLFGAFFEAIFSAVFALLNLV